MPAWITVMSNLERPTYYHLDVISGSMLRHNARLGHGFTITAGAMGHPGFVTRYQVLNTEQNKEAAWEAVRCKHFPNRPTRQGALFAFPSQEAMEIARQWGGDFGSRTVVRVSPTERSQAFIADAAWLNSPEQGWAESAHRYWSGERTASPQLEVILQGRVFCPDWQKFELLE